MSTIQETVSSDTDSGEGDHETTPPSMVDQNPDVLSDDASDGYSYYSDNSEYDEENYESTLSKYVFQLAKASDHSQTNETDLGKIRSLLRKDESIADLREADGKTALHIAAKYGLVDVARELLGTKRRNIEAKDKNGRQPLNTACKADQTEIAQLLLHQGADFEARDIKGYTPLHYASWKGHLETVQLLVNGYNANIDARGYHYLWTPLHLAIEENRTEVVYFLLDNGASLHLETDGGWTPLTTAIPRRPCIIQAVLDQHKKQDVHVDVPTHTGYTPLLWACRLDSYETVRLLIEAGANCMAVDHEKRTPLHWASKTGNEGMVKLLLDAKVSMNARSSSGNTPLHLASGVKRPGEDPEYDDPDELNVFGEECQGDHQDIVIQLLLESGAELEITNNEDETALHYAAERGDLNRLKPILEKTTKEVLTARNNRGWTALCSAYMGDHREDAMKALLEKESLEKADFGEEDVWKEAFGWAAQRSETRNIAELLIMKKPQLPVPPSLPSAESTLIEFAAHEAIPDVLSLLIQNSPDDHDTGKALRSALRSTLDTVDRRLKGKREVIIDEHLLKVVWLLTTTLNWESDIKTHVGETLVSVKKKRHELRNLAKSSAPRDSSKANAIDHSRRDEHPSRVKGTENERPTRGTQKPEQDKLGDTRPDYLAELEDILRVPPRTQFHQHFQGFTPPRPRSREIDGMLEKFEAAVTLFFEGAGESGTITRYRTVKDVIYDIGPNRIVEETIRTMSKITGNNYGLPGCSIKSDSEPQFTWVHLPATSMDWMNDLLTMIMQQSKYTPRQYHDVKSFFQNSAVHVPDKTSRSRFVRPRTVLKNQVENEDHDEGDKKVRRTKTIQEDDESQDVEYDESKSGTVIKERQDVAAMAIYASQTPYFHFSKYTPYKSRTKTGDTMGGSNQRMEDYEGLWKACGESAHESPTLDEWYYHFGDHDDSANDKNTRNISQVITKYLRNTRAESPKEGQETSTTPDQHEDQAEDITLLRVNQLWVWTIADKWLITATSCHLDQSHDTLEKEILEQFRTQAQSAGSSPQPRSTTDMSKLVVEHCIGSYERPPPSGCSVSIGQAFSHYLNRIGRDEAAIFEDFRNRTERWQLRRNSNRQGKMKKTSSPATGPAADEGSFVDASQTSPNDEIRDAIRKTEELFCDIKDVRDELNILRSAAQYQEIVQRRLYGKETKTSELLSASISNDIREMDTVAERIQLAVNTTLSLQQSEIANYQATLATSQGKTVMAFTFATVLFLPLSFLSSLFAMDVASFQQAPAWAFYVIFFVSIAVSVLLGFVAFHWDLIFSTVVQQLPSISKAISQALSNLSKSEIDEKAGARETKQTSEGGDINPGRQSREFSIV